MTGSQTRRRFLFMSAAAMAVSGAGPVNSVSQTASWRGVALGAAASLRIVGLEAVAARPILTAVERELARLEAVFSLYRSGSELSRLNATGRLVAPSPDLLAVLSTSDRLNRATDGAFDPTVQPLFAVYAEAAARGRWPDRSELGAARTLVGWTGVQFDTAEVRLLRPGAALTLNGIAQGYVTDRIAALLRQHGLSDVLVDIGEIAALGNGSGRRPWQAGIADTKGTVLRRVVLRDRALATSAPRGTVLDQAGALGHIFDPETGGEPARAGIISVSAPLAEVADGLSTALCVLDRTGWGEALAAFPGARLELAA